MSDENSYEQRQQAVVNAAGQEGCTTALDVEKIKNEARKKGVKQAAVCAFVGAVLVRGIVSWNVESNPSIDMFDRPIFYAIAGIAVYWLNFNVLNRKGL